MSPLTGTEQGIVDSLEAHGIDYAILEPTSTGLRKSTLDATKPVRAFLARQGLHDYSVQKQGTEFKRHLPAVFIREDKTASPTHASVVRPRSGNGDPRIWFPGLKDHCAPGEKVGLVNAAGELRVFNISRGVMIDLDDGAAGNADTDGAGRWALLARLWERSTGGRDVAATPANANDAFPAARRPAGVAEGIDWLRSTPRALGTARLLFLVGGPGAGKSHAAAEAVMDLPRVDAQDDGLAQRAYRYSWGEREFLLINDATITSDRYRRAPLSREIAGIVESGSLLMACINRGVLVEEAAALSSSNATVGSDVVRWLQSGESYAEALEDIDEVDGPVVISGQETSYLRTATVHFQDEVIADIVVVNVDSCSLLEATPRVLVESGLGGLRTLVPDSYRIAKTIKRDGLHADGTSGGQLFEAVVAALMDASSDDVPEGYFDPFDANIQSMASRQTQSGVLTLLRASEIVSGSTYTFRDLWGALSRCIVGAASSEYSHASARGLIHELQPASADPVKRFDEIRRLAQYRFSQALFGVGMDLPEKPSDPRNNPVTRRTSAVDPVIDTVPGEFSVEEPNAGWATPIVDAFSGPLTSGSPLESLVRLLDDNDSFIGVVTDFDRRLDHAFVEAVSVPRLSDPVREGLVAWYGRYITRLFAVAHGISAFRREISMWTLAWTMASELATASELPTLLENQLKTLVRPPRDGQGSNPLIPLLGSRAEPIIGDVVGAKLALASGPFDLRSSREGEELYFCVVEGATSSPRIRLDFALVRQAQSCTGGWIGVTEVADATSPRLERFRSTQLVGERGPFRENFVVVAGSAEYKIQAGA
ncbi:hypothetical protein [Agromyces sp. Root1464]|uniref:hypothetical protein n=1 Tax=Agromyces sp. Root1464 TaxID=1736467 RepID=UPI000A945B87|nr:hypothetical protein [Agromyces sp. Root1464]